jgi:predicted nuclease of predicted toxin-antitoxin system
MRFLVDAQLPRRLCAVHVKHGHDAIRTSDLPTGNETKDGVINQMAIDEDRVVVSKDTDFFYSHVAHGRPNKLLLVKTGNISTRDLCDLFERNVTLIKSALQTHSLVEIDRTTVTPITDR